MSTTVIASRHGLGLGLFPAASPRLDVEALRAVLARHGLDLIDGSDLATANALIAAQGLAPVAAGRLAEDLRGLELTVRVVNRTGLTGSRRLGEALAGQAVIGMAGVLAMVAGRTGLAEGDPRIGAAMLAVGALLAGLAALNGLVLQRGGAARLRLAGTLAPPADAALLTDQLSSLAADLPDHLAAPLLARAQRLEAHARKDPEGQAAAALRDLSDELRAAEDRTATDEAETLRQELAQAQRALRETQGR